MHHPSPRLSLPARLLLLASLVTAAAAPAVAEDDHVRRRMQARLERSEPIVDDVVAAALRYAGLAERPETGLRRRARLAAALPTLTLAASRDTTWAEADAGARIVGDVDRELVFEARATWRLDRLVFDGAELRAHALGQQRARARAAVAAQTTALFYRRRAAQLEAMWTAPATPAEQVRRDLAIEELSAQLDALTGGWWSSQLDE
jgi:hypothetical protein